MDTPVPAGASPARPSFAPVALADGRYVLGEVLGSGGMGLVYRARDGVLGREVAVKLLADNLAADDEARERFSREARAAARLTHPNVVQVFDVGEEDGRPYFVMELVAGASLADVLRDRGPLPAAEVEEAAVQSLQGIAKAHAAGLLHRDLKPANLLRSDDGTGVGVVKVTDFGVAQATELPGMTRTGLVLGTLPYLAPERLAGAPATVASDLYGLGATLLELLTGAPPDAARDDDGRWVVRELDTVPPRLTALLRSCLAADPAARPASAEAALELLDGPVVSPAPARATEVLATDDHAPTAATEVAGPLPQPLRARGWVRWLVLAGLALLVLLALAQLGDAGGSVDTGVPAGTTPEETARNLAEWLRDQAR